MEYHKDRFDDFSLLIFKDKELIALLPANRDGNSLHSHQGLTFGGLLIKPSITAIEIRDVIDALHLFLREIDFEQLCIKAIPEFYFKSISVDLCEILLEKNYKTISSKKVLVIDYSKPLTIHKTKLKRYRNNKYNFEIKESKEYNSFWNQVLVPRLADKYNTNPVHTLSEITMLNEKFPDKIKQFDIYLENEILAGITLFENETVVKSQYGAITEKGEKTRALDYLFLHLIFKYKELGKRFFSMGTIQDNNFEMGYNPGLLKQKQELGCKVYQQLILNIKL